MKKPMITLEITPGFLVDNPKVLRRLMDEITSQVMDRHGYVSSVLAKIEVRDVEAPDRPRY
jgi:hypothetical protein